MEGIMPALGDEGLVRVTEDDVADMKASLIRKLAEPIKFKAEVAKVQTTTDGGIRLTLDLPEDGRKVMADLADCQQNGVYLTIEATKT